MAGISVDIKSHVWRGVNFQSCKTLKIAEELNGPQVSNEYVNQVHRRLILKDLGKPIHTVDSPVCLLGALKGCIKGHQALLKAGYLHYQESQPFLDCIANFAKIMLRHQKNRNHQQPTNVYGDIVHGEILVIFKKAKKELQEVEPLSQS
ncbi:hypothetical protein PCANC_13489 [Puccinia coronata f. sp. avenae]|uniref:Fungal-type protein kinase domain-containing protein n=1 Tax=Puccinia coronata f. sp. avenae TaxID=200324 RepID=A0A2N5V4N1_9BASI|nr:hypothetical protein PCANC_13489 [Puccinia coronata f. sp. avenae]